MKKKNGIIISLFHYSIPSKMTCFTSIRHGFRENDNFLITGVWRGPSSVGGGVGMMSLTLRANSLK